MTLLSKYLPAVFHPLGLAKPSNANPAENGELIFPKGPDLIPPVVIADMARAYDDQKDSEIVTVFPPIHFGDAEKIRLKKIITGDSNSDSLKQITTAEPIDLVTQANDHWIQIGTQKVFLPKSSYINSGACGWLKVIAGDEITIGNLTLPDMAELNALSRNLGHLLQPHYQAIQGHAPIDDVDDTKNNIPISPALPFLGRYSYVSIKADYENGGFIFGIPVNEIIHMTLYDNDEFHFDFEGTTYVFNLDGILLEKFETTYLNLDLGTYGKELAQRNAAAVSESRLRRQRWPFFFFKP